MNYYPPLANIDVGLLRDLRVIASNIQETHDYLEDECCPYSAEVVLHLKNLLTSPTPSMEEPKESNTINVSQEPFDPVKLCEEQIRDLQALKNESKSLSTSEKIQTYKLISTQLEKLTDVKKDLERVEEYQRFKTVLFETLERYLSPSQIGEFMSDFEDSTNSNPRTANL